MKAASPSMFSRLIQHPFLDGIKARHLEILAQAASPARFEKGRLIFKAGESAKEFYLIEKGEVALEGSVFEHGLITTDIVRAGEPLGWSWLFPPYRWHFDARATQPTEAIRFSSEVLHQHRDEDLELSHELFKRASEVMARRLQHTRAKLVAQARVAEPRVRP